MIRFQVRSAATLCAVLAALLGCAVQQVPPVEGTVWQIDNDTFMPKGDWDRLGAKRLLVFLDRMVFIQV